jgi:hypothetical protein
MLQAMSARSVLFSTDLRLISEAHHARCEVPLGEGIAVDPSTCPREIDQRGRRHAAIV